MLLHLIQQGFDHVEDALSVVVAHCFAQSLLRQNERLFHLGAHSLSVIKRVQRPFHLLKKVDETIGCGGVAGRDARVQLGQEDFGLIAEGKRFSVLGLNHNLPVAHAVPVLNIDQIDEEIKQLAASGELFRREINGLIRGDHAAQVGDGGRRFVKPTCQHLLLQIGEGFLDGQGSRLPLFVGKVGLQDREIAA